MRAGAFDDAMRLPLAYVGTVHAACLRLLQEFALDAGLSPGVDVIAGDQGKLLRQALEAELPAENRERLEQLAWRFQLRIDPKVARVDWHTTVADIMELAGDSDQQRRTRGMIGMQTMRSHRFARYTLRTTDAIAAAAFYEGVLGPVALEIFPLHEQAIARGARPHWLGQIDVEDPASHAAALLAEGGERLGERPDGVVVLRHGGGAIVALGPVRDATGAAPVLWHVLRAFNAPRVAALYRQHLGWQFGEPVSLRNGELYQPFAWTRDSADVGGVGEITEGVHPQWLYFFAAQSVLAASAKVRALGGSVADTGTTPKGRAYAVCDDPQGAAFGLMEE